LTAALFLCQWLRSIENEANANLTEEEAKIVSLLRDLIFEADPDADPAQPLSSSFLMVWADAKCDGVSVWDGTEICNMF
jgi:hypothetical protein